MSYIKQLKVNVAAITQVTPEIKHFVLEPVNGSRLPNFSGGSHIVVVMRDGQALYKNAYSLVGDGHLNDTYEIAVRLEKESRGGSRYMHQQVVVGDILEILPPANLFALERFAHKHLLIAGGVGITPFCSMLHDVQRGDAEYELHYCVRGLEHAAFWEKLALEHKDRVLLHHGADHLDVNQLLASQPMGTHVYVCGPTSLIDDVKESALRNGWSPAHIHYEEFVHAEGGNPFSVDLASSGKTVDVRGNQTLLEAMEEAGVDVPFMCRGGVCGACETEVVSGEVDHRDQFLSDAEKAQMKKMMVCVSRSACLRLTLAL